MNKIIPEMPISIAMEFTGGNFAHADVSGFFATSFLAPSYADLGGKLSDVFVIFGISPKFYLGSRFFFDDFTNYGDGWSDMSPRASAHY